MKKNFFTFFMLSLRNEYSEKVSIVKLHFPLSNACIYDWSTNCKRSLGTQTKLLQVA